MGAYETVLDRTDWPNLESRVAGQMDRLLDMLAASTTKATLFILGSVAEKHGAILRRARAAGHEIACHGLDHKRLYTLDEEACFQDIDRAKKAIEDACGIAVRGYRAPSFSLTPEVRFVYHILAELGFDYSSSIYPLKTDHYGDAAADRTPYWPVTDLPLLEVPMTTWKAFGRRWPVSGGGYFRLLPGPLGRILLLRGARQIGVPGNFYMHPWEIDPKQPTVPNAPWKSRFRHRVNQRGMLRKVERMVRYTFFGPIYETMVRPILLRELDADCHDAAG